MSRVRRAPKSASGAEQTLSEAEPTPADHPSPTFTVRYCECCRLPIAATGAEVNVASAVMAIHDPHRATMVDPTRSGSSIG